MRKQTFDLHNLDFQRWLKVKGLWHLAGNGKRFKFVASPKGDRALFNKHFRYAQEYKGERYRFSDCEMVTHWQIMLDTKRTFQDEWVKFNESLNGVDS